LRVKGNGSRVPTPIGPVITGTFVLAVHLVPTRTCVTARMTPISCGTLAASAEHLHDA